MRSPMDNNPDRAVAIFNTVLQLPVGQRGAYLDEVCAGDNALRLKIEVLLGVHDEVGTFLEFPTQEPGSSGKVPRSEPSLEQSGQLI